MQKSFITTNAKQTQKLGEILAKELKTGAIICLDGELGAGKTTFTQGFLRGLKIKGPYTSPTFLIMKEYDFEKIKNPMPTGRQEKSKIKTASQNSKIEKVYHIDAYRIVSNDIINLGWKEIISNSQNIVIIEWASRIEKILPKNILQISFEWLGPPCVDERTSSQVEAGENKRKIIFSVKSEK